MNNRHSLILAAVVLAVATTSLAQTSVGYTDPDDTTALYEYRLPDWSWHSWRGEFDANGGGSSAGERQSHRHSLALASSFSWQRESENLDSWISLLTEMSGQVGGNESDGDEMDSDAFSSHNRASVGINRYLGATELYVAARAHGTHEYRHTKTESDERQYRRFLRTYTVDGEVSVGVGRLREITPLLRAQRLSERLRALGHRPLGRAQLIAVAEVMARRGGYDATFDRPDRHFWRDVLEPLLDLERPLSPYEVLYLLDVEREEFGSRYQGASISVGGELWQRAEIEDIGRESEFMSDSQTLDERPHGLGTQARADLWHNYSLDTALHLAGYARYRWYNNIDGDADIGYAQLGASWLRHVSDRQRLEVEVRAYGSYREEAGERIQRNGRVELRAADEIWVEDSLTLNPFVTLYRSASTGTHPNTTWSYGISLNYRFSRFLG